MKYQVVFSPEAQDDLERLFDHVLERELNSATGDLEIPARAIESIQQACQLLEHSPFADFQTLSEAPGTHRWILFEQQKDTFGSALVRDR